MPSRELIEAVAVTAELCGRTFSEAAARVFIADLAAYPEPAVLASLARCRKEVRGILTVQDVISRLEDGRPGPEEAWAMLPRDERSSVVWTEEMAAAFGVVAGMIAAGEEVAARMAFKEAYLRAVGEARNACIHVKWTPSLGHDPAGRESVLMEAARKGRLPIAHVQALIPHAVTPEAIALIEGEKQRLRLGKAA